VEAGIVKTFWFMGRISATSSSGVDAMSVGVLPLPLRVGSLPRRNTLHESPLSSVWMEQDATNVKDGGSNPSVGAAHYEEISIV
jgi:hypothetical protein